MRIPMWLGLLIASAVILFAGYRLWLAFGGPSDEERQKHRRGMLAMPRRQHGAIGIIFLLVAGALVATSLGWNPFQRQRETADTKTPADAPKAKPGIVVE